MRDQRDHNIQQDSDRGGLPHAPTLQWAILIPYDGDNGTAVAQSPCACVLKKKSYVHTAPVPVALKSSLPPPLPTPTLPALRQPPLAY